MVGALAGAGLTATAVSRRPSSSIASLSSGSSINQSPLSANPAGKISASQNPSQVSGVKPTPLNPSQLNPSSGNQSPINTSALNTSSVNPSPVNSSLHQGSIAQHSEPQTVKPPREALVSLTKGALGAAALSSSGHWHGEVQASTQLAGTSTQASAFSGQGADVAGGPAIPVTLVGEAPEVPAFNGTNTSANSMGEAEQDFDNTSGSSSSRSSSQAGSEVKEGDYGAARQSTGEPNTTSAAEPKPDEAQQKQQQNRESREQQALEREIDSLMKRDTQVRSHEQAHAAVGGIHAGQPAFEFEKGPDGKRYAVEGEVQIDVSVVNGDPLATMAKMKQVYAAAMAPVAPSMADIRVAAEAMRKYNQAREEAGTQRLAAAPKPELSQNLLGAVDPAAEKSAPSFEPKAGDSANFPIGLSRLMGAIAQQSNALNEQTFSPSKAELQFESGSVADVIAAEQQQAQRIRDESR
ncbi:putative metalloprotease CJM1_0395 family protein [Shewanella indica]|uniref:Metalloprotease CJM1_0395 family protein n=1 Tax=Shewanella indica TaxID=768528 RepID=A0ABU4QEZ5_9GAMM|nr:putative metalloprotease CJM1_0395 family protein [Shewanella indica]MDX6017947.1 putative metalloprotease CJM1_0395 family protein [Shewanella indica]